MSAFEDPPEPFLNRTVVVTIFVVAFHVVALWLLQTGMLRRAVELVVPAQGDRRIHRAAASPDEPPPPPPPPPEAIRRSGSSRPRRADRDRRPDAGAQMRPWA